MFQAPNKLPIQYLNVDVEWKWLFVHMAKHVKRWLGATDLPVGIHNKIRCQGTIDRMTFDSIVKRSLQAGPVNAKSIETYFPKLLQLLQIA